MATVNKTEGTDTLTVTFDASASYDEDGTIATYHWDFGDGATAEGEMVSHLFESYSTYNVVLTVTDNEGTESTKTFVIKVKSSMPVSDCGSPLSMMAKDFPLTGYYLDNYTGQNILAITPGTAPVSATTEKTFTGESCTYRIIFHGVGENDGQSSFKILVNDVEVGAYQIPLSTEGYEYGSQYNLKIEEVEIANGDKIKVIGTTGSADGKEWSRARWLKIEFLPMGYIVGDCEGALFVEKEGIVVMEAESVAPVNGWKKMTSPAGFHGSAFYMWDGSDNFSNPGVGTMEFKFKINNPGTYHFRWHNKIMHGTVNTESNDTWMKILGADDFFSKTGSSVKYPNGGMFKQSNTIVKGTSMSGWMKVYSSGTIDWTWSSRTSDGEPHEIYATFNKPGVYTLQISGRSRYHAIDRIVLFQDSKYSVAQATAASLQETLCTGGSSELNETVSYNANAIGLYPNPVSDVLSINHFDRYTSYTVINMQGQTLIQVEANSNEQKKIDVSVLPTGIYYLFAQGANGNASTSFVKK